MTLTEAIEKFGLDLAVMLWSRGGDEQALDEIAKSLKRGRERYKKLPPPTPEEIESARIAGLIVIEGGRGTA